MISFLLGVVVGACGLYIIRNGWNVFRVRIGELLTFAWLSEWLRARKDRAAAALKESAELLEK